MSRALVVALLLVPLPAQSLTWVEGPSAAALTLRTVHEADPGGAPSTVLGNLELLPIEITGRTLQMELDPSRSQRIARDGLVSLELPGGGRVLAYRRHSGQSYGFLLIRPDGTPRVLLELPGVGGGSPFADRIGLSPDGRWAVASSAAETTLYILRLDGSSFVSTGTPARSLALPAAVEVTSIMPGSRYVFFAGDDERLRRCAMADGGVPEDASPPTIAGARLKSELALAGNGRTVAFLYGVQPSFSLWLAGESGPPVRVNAPVAKYEEPGYLPETPDGPRLLLNHDGTRLLYTDAGLRDELFLYDTTGATVTTHVTGDHNFEPYIGIGIFPTFAASVLVLGVGDPDQFDVYAATTGETPVENLTRTGTLTRPYFPGALVPRLVTLTGDGTVLTVDQPPNAPTRLLRTDPQTLTTAVAADRLDRLPYLAGSLAGAPDLVVSSAAGDRLLDGAHALPLLVTPPGVDLTAAVLLDAGWRVLGVSASGLSAVAFRAPDGTLLGLPPVVGAQRITVTGAGNLVLDGSTLVHVSPGLGAVRVNAGGAVRRVLAGER